MAKRVRNQKAKETLSIETPNEGDWISVTFDGHPNSWWGPLCYYATIDDPEKGRIKGACVLTGNSSEQGKLSVLFENVEFWQVWEGETNEEYQNRRKEIIADLQRQKIPIDPIDSFDGENSQQGTWSKPKFGPAFKVMPVEGTWTRPNDEDLIDVHVVGGFEDTQCGRFLKAADMIYREDRLGTKRVQVNGVSPFDPQAFRVGFEVLLGHRDNVPGVEVETTLSERFRYSPPFMPFAKWIRFRVLNEDRSPKSDWQIAPHYSEWSREDKLRRTTKLFEENKVRFENVSAALLEYFKTESSLAMRRVRALDLLSNVANAGFHSQLDPGGGGDFFRGMWTEFLKREIHTLERALNIVPGTLPQADSSKVDQLAKPYGERDDNDLLTREETTAIHDKWMMGGPAFDGELFDKFEKLEARKSDAKKVLDVLRVDDQRIRNEEFMRQSFAEERLAQKVADKIASRKVMIAEQEPSTLVTLPLIPEPITNGSRPLVFSSIWIRGESDSGLAVLNIAMRKAQMIDDEGQWTTHLEVIGELLRELPPFVPANPAGRNGLSKELRVPQGDGTFDFVLISQLNNAYKRAISISPEVKEIVRQVKAHSESAK